MKGYIYEIINIINGKKYIGQTINIKHRIEEHFSSLRKGNHHSTKLQRAFDKYGESNFKVAYKEYDICDIEELHLLEIKAIEEADSYNNGYNMTLGGEGWRTKLDFHNSILIYQIGQRYSGVGHKLSKYFDCDSSVIYSTFENESFVSEPYDKQELEDLITKVGLQDENLKENYVKHNDRKLGREQVLAILSIIEFYDNCMRPCATIFNIHYKAIERLKARTIYKEWCEEYDSMPEIERKKMAEENYKKYDVFNITSQRKRNGVTNPLTQEDVNYILDNVGVKKKAQIARDLGISADRVGSVTRGISYKDLVANYYKNKNKTAVDKSLN